MRRPLKWATAAEAIGLSVFVLLLGGGSAVADSGRSSLEASIREPSVLRGYGCKFVPSLCGGSDVCFDDNLFGSCRRTLDPTAERWRAPADDDLRTTLEGVLSELVSMGYSWHHAFTQCVVDAALLSYRLRARTAVRASTCLAYARAADRRALQLQPLLAPGGAYYVKPQAPSRSEDRIRASAERPLPSVDQLRGSRLGAVAYLPLNRERPSSRRKDEEAERARGKEDLEKIQRPHSSLAAERYSAASRRVDAASAKAASPAATDVDLESLLLRLLTGELALKQVPLDVTDKLADYIGAILQEVQEEKEPVKSGKSEPKTASARDSLGEAARHFLPPSKLSATGAEIAKTAEGMAIDVNGSNSSSSSSGGGNSGSVGGVSSVGRMMPDGDSKSLLKSASSNSTPNSESYAWMILSPSISDDSAHRLADTLNNLLKEMANNTSVTAVRVDHNAIVVETSPSGTHALQLHRLADVLEEHKEAIEENLGISIMKSGAGHEILSGVDAQYNAQSPGTEQLANFTAYALPATANQTRRHMFIAVFALCGAAVGVGGALAVICVIRRCQRRRGWKLTRGKDYPLSSDEADDETGCLTHDYEDLVRQHIHSKSSEQSDSPTGSSVGGRNASPTDDLEAAAAAGGRRSARSSQSSWSEEPAVCSMDVSTGHMILSYMEDHLKNKDRLQEEWQALCSYHADLGGSDVALLPKNKKKNRQHSILPYDHNRVVLDETKNVSGDDYINASFVADHHPRTASYIATQGPLATTVADFWQMVWERGTVVIVMLTRLSENGTNGGGGAAGSAQCHRFWPNGSSELYHIYEVHLVSEHVWCDDYLVRSFYLKNLETNETRTVTQFHFLAWPDGGVPTSTKTLLDFRRKMNKSYRGRSCPIVVVCSNGAGRSGAFILLDMVINRLCKGAKEIDIAATLEHIRDQRMSAVQTKEQFEFVLSSIAEEVQAMLMSA